MFKAIIGDARFWKKLLTAISTLIDEADFQVSPEGIKLRSMDPSHVALVDFEYPKESFEEYTCEKPFKIRVALNSILKLMKRLKDEKLELTYDDEKKKLKMNLTNAIQREFIISTLDPGDEETPVPKLEPDSIVKLSSTIFKDIIDDSMEVSDNITIETTSDMFIAKAAEELHNAQFEVPKDSEALLDLEVKKPSKSTYNLNYLSEMVKAGADASEIITISFATKMPVKIELTLPQQGKLLYYLAPRIEAE